MKFRPQFSLRTLFVAVGVVAICVILFPVLFPPAEEKFTPNGYLLGEHNIAKEWPPKPTDRALYACTVYWFSDESGQVVSAFAAFGENRPGIMISHQHGHIQVPSLKSPKIKIPQDKVLYVLGPDMELHKTSVPVDEIAKGWQHYPAWARPLASKIEAQLWP